MAAWGTVTSRAACSQPVPFLHPASLGASRLPPPHQRALHLASAARCIRTRAAQTELATETDVAAISNALKQAVAAEDYALAARLHKELSQRPEVLLEAQLEQAIREENYPEAARLRDRLTELRPPPPQTCSNCVTDGVRVIVQSRYAKPKSSPGHSYVFTYEVTIQNESDATVQLRNRHWAISNSGTGATEEIRGPGVVGEQPKLAPGQAFNYSSYCQLSAPTGYMEGSYEFVELKEGRPVRTFEVAIGRFHLAATEE